MSPQSVLYDLVIEAWHGRVQDAFVLARSLAVITNHPVIVRGNQTAVTVTPQMTEEMCEQAYTRALDDRDPPP